MANRTDAAALTLHGKNPQLLFSRIVRRKVYESFFWKNDCFACTAESLVDVAVKQLKYIGGTYGGIRTPSPFLCLVLKLLQLQPDKEIILEYIKQEDFKYLRAVGAFYFRIAGRSDEVYIHLEPLLADYRKLRVRENSGRFVIQHMDEFVDACLRKNTMFDVDLPPLAKRHIFVEQQLLPAMRLSALEDELQQEGDSPLTEAQAHALLLSKRLLQQQQKKLQQHVLQQRSRQIQQEKEKEAARQIQQLEAETAPDDAKRRRVEERGDRDRDKERDRERERQRQRETEKDRLRDRDRPTESYTERDRADKDRDRDRERNRDRDRERGDRERERERDRGDRDKERDRERDRGDRDRDRDREKHRDRDRDRERERDRGDRDREKHRERDRGDRDRGDRDREKYRDRSKRERDRDGEGRHQIKTERDKQQDKAAAAAAAAAAAGNGSSSSSKRGVKETQTKKEGLSVDEWNKIREGLGLKRLKE